MLIITMTEHFFTGTHLATGADKHKTRTVAFATDLGLATALRRIKAYEQAYKGRFKSTAVEFTLVSVSDVPTNSAMATKEVLQGAGAFLVESLPQTAEEMLAA
jgi:hypothetical protein